MQRKDRLLITIKVKECKDADVRLFAEGRISFKGSSIAKTGLEAVFAVELDLFGAISPDVSVTEVKTGGIELTVVKKETADHWPRLVKDSGKNNRISVDFARYIDQDDEEREQQKADLQNLKDKLDGVGGGDSTKVSSAQPWFTGDFSGTFLLTILGGVSSLWPSDGGGGDGRRGICDDDASVSGHAIHGDRVRVGLRAAARRDLIAERW